MVKPSLDGDTRKRDHRPDERTSPNTLVPKAISNRKGPNNRPAKMDRECIIPPLRLETEDMVSVCSGGWTQRTWHQVVVEAGHSGHGIRLWWKLDTEDMVSGCVGV